MWTISASPRSTMTSHGRISSPKSRSTGRRRRSSSSSRIRRVIPATRRWTLPSLKSTLSAPRSLTTSTHKSSYARDTSRLSPRFFSWRTDYFFWTPPDVAAVTAWIHATATRTVSRAPSRFRRNTRSAWRRGSLWLLHFPVTRRRRRSFCSSPRMAFRWWRRTVIATTRCT